MRFNILFWVFTKKFSSKGLPLCENQLLSFRTIFSVLNWGSSCQAWALARDIVLCSWARHFTLTVALSSHVHKWVLVNLMLAEEIILVTSCCRNWDKRLPYGPLGSCADLPNFFPDNRKETPDLNNWVCKGINIARILVPVKLMSTETTPSWCPSKLNLGSSFSSFL